MKLWRVHWHTENGNSAGFTWYRTKRLAKFDMARVIKRDDLVDSDLPELEGFDLRANARGLFAALRRFAEHPDNG